MPAVVPHPPEAAPPPETASPERAPTERQSYGLSAGFGVLTFFAMAVLGLVSSIVLARIFGVEVIGEYTLILVPLAVLQRVSTAGEQVALVRALSPLPLRDPHATALFLVVLTFSAVLTLVMAALLVGALTVGYAAMDQSELLAPAAVLVAGYVVLRNAVWNLEIVLGAFRAGRDLFWVRLCQVVTFFAVAVWLGLESETVWALVWATLASWAISLAQALVMARHVLIYRVGAAELREAARELPAMVRFGVKGVPGWIAEGLTFEGGTWILGLVAPLAVVGAWGRAWLLARRLIEATYRVTEMLLPTLYDHEGRGRRDAYDLALVDTMRYSVVGLLLPAAVAGGASHGVMELFGPGFEQGADAFAVVMLVPALYALSSVLGASLVVEDRLGLNSILLGVRLLAVLLLTIALTDWLGATGVAIALVSGLVLDVGWRLHLAGQKLTTPMGAIWPGRTVAVTLLAFAAGFAAARALDLALAGPLRLPAAFAAGALVYGGLLWTGGAALPRDRERIGLLARRLRPAP